MLFRRMPGRPSGRMRVIHRRWRYLLALSRIPLLQIRYRSSTLPCPSDRLHRHCRRDRRFSTADRHRVHRSPRPLRCRRNRSPSDRLPPLQPHRGLIPQPHGRVAAQTCGNRPRQRQPPLRLTRRCCRWAAPTSSAQLRSRPPRGAPRCPHTLTSRGRALPLQWGHDALLHRRPRPRLPVLRGCRRRSNRRPLPMCH
jgi:hypothetical protein